MLVLLSIGQVMLSGAVLPLGSGPKQWISYAAPAQWGFAATASTVNLKTLLPPHPSHRRSGPTRPTAWLLAVGMQVVLAGVFAFIAWRRVTPDQPRPRPAAGPGSPSPSPSPPAAPLPSLGTGDPFARRVGGTGCGRHASPNERHKSSSASCSSRLPRDASPTRTLPQPRLLDQYVSTRQVGRVHPENQPRVYPLDHQTRVRVHAGP